MINNFKYKNRTIRLILNLIAALSLFLYFNSEIQLGNNQYWLDLPNDLTPILLARAASSNGLMISQVMIGQDGATTNEFVELFNASDNDIDLSSYSLKKKTQSGTESSLVSSTKFVGVIFAHGFFLISSVAYQDSIQADLAYSGASYGISVNNTILLYDDAGNLLDKVGYGEASDFENAAAPGPVNGQSLARKTLNNSLIDSDNNQADFIICDSLLPRNTLSAQLNNSNETEDQISDDSNGDAEQLAPSVSGGLSGSVIADQAVMINEFVSDPSDGDTEWVELYLKSDQAIDLDNWTLEDGSGSKTALDSIFSTENRYKVIEKPKGNLNNTGDIIILRDQDGWIVDQVAYGNWLEQAEKNAPAAKDPMSTARISDGLTTGDQARDFVITTSPTKGSANVISADGTGPESKDGTIGDKEEIMITELLPNPFGLDYGLNSEFIELYNFSGKNVSLYGWKITLSNGQETNIEKCVEMTSVKPGNCFLVFGRHCNLVLPNNGASVKLYDPNGKIIQTVTYKKAEEGKSYNYDKKSGSGQTK